MSYLLVIDASPMGEQSVSRKLATSYTETYLQAHPNIQIKHRDLDQQPVPHVDAECIHASYVPPEKRPSSQKEKHNLRLELITELINAHAIVISSPMWNFNVPSVLKAYIDQIILTGSLDPFGSRKLVGKQVTIFVATGGGGYSHPRRKSDFVSDYLKHSKLDVFNQVHYPRDLFCPRVYVVATILGATDVQVIRSEFTLAGVAPGMDSLIPEKEKSYAEALALTIQRASSSSSR